MTDSKPSIEQNVAHLMARVANRLPQKPALVFESHGKHQTISFGDLWRDAKGVANNLQAMGLKPGDRVIIMIPMSIDLYVCLLGIIQMGAVVVFVDPWIGARQIARFSEFAEPKAFIGINKSHLLRWSRRQLRQIKISVTNGFRVGPFFANHSLASLKRSECDSEVAPVTPDRTALITFTSGSSGMPKGANRTHRFLLAQHLALKQEFPYLPDDVDMPMFPVFALNNLVTGITSVVPEMDFRKVAEVDGGKILAQMIGQGITTCTASPPLLDKLADALEAVDADAKSEFRLRRVLTGGAPVSDEQLIRWSKTFQTPAGPTEVIVAYGSTEAEPVGHINADERIKLTSVGKGFCTGRPTELTQTMVIPIVKGAIDLSATTLPEIALPPLQTGELIVAGDHVCRDYYNDATATAENKLIDRQGTVWHRMGDTGYFDEEGRFWLVGRVHSTIIRDGRQIDAQMVEQIAKSVCPHAIQVAAIGYDVPALGESVVMLVQVKNDTKEVASDVRVQIKTGLLEMNYPCDHVIVSEKKIPLDPRHNSKIDYQKAKGLLPKPNWPGWLERQGSQ